MNYKDIVELDEKGELSPILRALWKERNGNDPLEIARDVVKKSRKANLWTIAAALIILVGIVLVILGLFASSWERGRLLVMCGAALGMMSSAAWFIFSGDDRDEERVGEDFYFPSHLHRFLEWSGKTSAELAPMNQRDLYLLADEILVVQACEVLRNEKSNEGVPREHWKDSAVQLERIFGVQHRILFDLGLVSGGTFKKYYDLARKRLEAETAS